MPKKALLSILPSIFLSALFILTSCGEQNDSLISKADEEWIQGHNHSALELLNEVLKKYPTGPKAEEALFRMGEIHHYSFDNSTRALNYFQEVRQMNRQGPFSYDAQKYIAEIAEFGLKDYDQAIIYLFSYELIQLDKAALIKLTRGKTNHQYLREVLPNENLKTRLSNTVRAFEDVFFGNKELSRRRFEECWQEVSTFQDLIPSQQVGLV